MALRLIVRLKKSHGPPLIDVPIPPVKGYVEERSGRSDEFHTPGGLPLKVAAYFHGDYGTVRVMSAETVLLEMQSHRSVHASLWLPTDEVIYVGVEDHR